MESARGYRELPVADRPEGTRRGGGDGPGSAGMPLLCGSAAGPRLTCHPLRSRRPRLSLQGLSRVANRQVDNAPVKVRGAEPTAGLPRRLCLLVLNEMRERIEDLLGAQSAVHRVRQTRIAGIFKAERTASGVLVRPPLSVTPQRERVSAGDVRRSKWAGISKGR